MISIVGESFRRKEESHRCCIHLDDWRGFSKRKTGSTGSSPYSRNEGKTEC